MLYHLVLLLVEVHSLGLMHILLWHLLCLRMLHPLRRLLIYWLGKVVNLLWKMLRRLLTMMPLSGLPASC